MSAVVAAPISLASSDALLPSTVVPSTLRKSLSATPEPNCATFVFDIPTASVAAVPKPMSDRTSDALRLSNPFAVNLANSSSATLELSIFTAIVSDIPKVKLA